MRSQALRQMSLIQVNMSGRPPRTSPTWLTRSSAVRPRTSTSLSLAISTAWRSPGLGHEHEHVKWATFVPHARAPPGIDLVLQGSTSTSASSVRKAPPGLNAAMSAHRIGSSSRRPCAQPLPSGGDRPTAAARVSS
jgi:hypothetical protein